MGNGLVFEFWSAEGISQDGKSMILFTRREETVMPDANEPVRKAVLEESANELMRVELHGALNAAKAV